MMKNPLISVIVPVYKTEQYLDRCVESIVNQTYQNLEIILVDDGSPDNCPQMCDDWAKKDERIKVIHLENGGVANARNQGLKIANGEYIGFVDGDDWIEDRMYEILQNNMVDNDADISVCGYQINVENDVAANIRQVSQFDSLKQICTGDYKYGVLWNKLYKSSVVQNHEMPNLVCCEDLVFNYYVFKNAKTVIECDSKLYHYFQNKDSTVHSEFKIGAFDAIKSKEIILSEEENTALKEYAVRGLVSSCFVVISGVVNSGKFVNQYDNIRRSILKYKIVILKSDMYSLKEKAKTIILWMSSKFYNKMIKKK